MSSTPTTIIVGEVSNNLIVVTITGPLAVYVEGLKRYVQRSVRDTEVTVNESDGTIVAPCRLTNKDDTKQQVRIRMRNSCRDWIADVTGYMSNTGADGDRVDLIEDARSVV